LKKLLKVLAETVAMYLVVMALIAVAVVPGMIADMYLGPDIGAFVGLASFAFATLFTFNYFTTN
jgi:hypothetical protein